MFQKMRPRPGFKITPWVVISTLLWVVSCAEVPITHRHSLHLVPDSELLSLSYQQYDQVLDQSKLSDDAEATAMIRRVGLRIQGAVERYFQQIGRLDHLDGVGRRAADVRFRLHLGRSVHISDHRHARKGLAQPANVGSRAYRANCPFDTEGQFLFQKGMHSQ